MSPDVRMLGDRYEVGDVIGRGGMAEVHEGRDRRLGRRVAIKILRPDLARDPSFQARFRREAQSAAALNHPNIVAVYDTGEDALVGTDGTSVVVPFIVMEYVDGMTLRQLLASGRRLLPERALEITSGVLSALDYAHRHGIVHRDIKPGNFMLTRSGNVKVMDFGIARAINEAGSTMTATSAVMGTAQYLSPEQARGEVVDARSDLYSTGVLLYELLTGEPPFTGDSPVSIAYQHVSEMPTPPSQIDPSISPAIDSIVLHALAKRADERYQTAAEFRADVDRAIAGGPVTAAVPTITADRTAMMPPVQASGVAEPVMYSERRPRKRRRSFGFWALAFVGVVAAIVGALLVAQFLFGSTAARQVQVPVLDGLTIEQAATELQKYELRLGAQTPETSERPEGTIIAQQPAAGESIEQGQSVNVTVSTGLEQTTVPQLMALTSIEDARTALADNNLVLGSITEQNSQQPAGYVLEQMPIEGTQVDAGTAVDIVVSSGLVKVPKVVGLTEAQALSDLAQRGFEVQVIRQETETSYPGTVMAQTPRAGEELIRGSIVTITVAVGAPPEPQPEPTATMPTDPAQTVEPAPTEFPVEPTAPAPAATTPAP